jgi:hypothetical protein
LKLRGTDSYQNRAPELYRNNDWSMNGQNREPNIRGKVRFKRKGRPPVTMTKDDIQLLYEYDRWANNRVLQAVSVFSDEQFTRV